MSQQQLLIRYGLKKSGEINTLQFDPVYYAKTKDSGVISGRTEFHVGDTIKRIRYTHIK
jgi:hypothetical protein